MNALERAERALQNYTVDENGCWLWGGCKGSRGYGKMTFGCHPWRAHRLAYAVYNGDLDERLVVCHSCDVPACINPAHLWQGTQRENVHDALAKGRPIGRPRKVA